VLASIELWIAMRYPVLKRNFRQMHSYTNWAGGMEHAGERNNVGWIRGKNSIPLSLTPCSHFWDSTGVWVEISKVLDFIEDPDPLFDPAWVVHDPAVVDV